MACRQRRFLFATAPRLMPTVRRLAKPIGKSDLYDKETLHEFNY
jgi:hypothetical protein